MSDNSSQRPNKQPANLPVEGLARTVIRTLSKKPGAARSKRLNEVGNRLLDASLNNDSISFEDFMAASPGLRVSESDLFDYCVPAAATALGDRWHDDTLTFAEVSMASARLYRLCLSFEEVSDDSAAHGFSILLASLKREDHIIGPALLARKLRREGNAVVLMSNCTVADIAQRSKHGNFDCLMISVASLSALDAATAAIQYLRTEGKEGLPIFVGGAALDCGVGMEQETGADLVTSDINVALDALRERRDSKRTETTK